MNCGDIRLQLAQHTALTPADAVAIEAHLTTCDACRLLVADLETQTEQWFELLGKTTAYPPVALRVATRSRLIGLTNNAPRFGQSRRLLALGFAALILIGCVWFASIRWFLPATERGLEQAYNGTSLATVTQFIAEKPATPTLTPASQHPERLSTTNPTKVAHPLETAITISPIIANPLPTQVRPIVPPTQALPAQTMIPIVTQEPLPTTMPQPTEEPSTAVLPTTIPIVPSQELSTAIPPTTAPVLPTTVPQAPQLPTAIGTPNPPTAIGTPNLPTAIGTPNPPTAIGTPVMPTAIGTPNPPASPTATSKVVPSPLSTTQLLSPTPTSDDQRTNRNH
ncbi:MAG TPA: hypothetical protein DEF47_08975 [Herpetosiphon sp.]|uniref:Putative zinc-finger domain-containing protein n=1 Tax=Herpetosiphon aurantiacus (strain ATCC 23779 / DSM 785 / 114-95) TaxID=316274 RepID=A9AUM9_HERA2|nr:zf-HC2 domain-containing protein [Herpetosiphon sp.]ABX04556.1 hypothetical protein Haur_1913 [Herpetosiphon aurantiacus DSM 785]HBW50027.1 hypothetical protein [Herpetosiphon sp.]